MISALVLAVAIAQAPKTDAVCLDLAGRQIVPLSRKTPSKATVLIFYIAHCPISQQMTPEINRVYKEFSPKGVRFFMVHEDLTLPNSEVAKEAKSYGLLPTVVVDRWRSQLKQSGAGTSPEAFVYDSALMPTYQGRITDLFYDLGKMRPKARTRDLRDAISSTLAGTVKRVKRTDAIGCVLPRG